MQRAIKKKKKELNYAGCPLFIVTRWVRISCEFSCNGIKIVARKDSIISFAWTIVYWREICCLNMLSS